jgi:hypothetical protein
MPELGSYGSVRGARGNSRPYREKHLLAASISPFDPTETFDPVTRSTFVVSSALLARLTQDTSWPKHPLYPAIRYEPDCCNERIEGDRGWRAEEGQGDGHNVEQNRHDPLAVAAQRDCQV